MLFNRKIEIKLVKEDKSKDDTPEPNTQIEYVAIAKDVVKNLVIGTCIIIATTVVLTTLSQIAVNALDNPESK